MKLLITIFLICFCSGCKMKYRTQYVKRIDFVAIYPVYISYGKDNQIIFGIFDTTGQKANFQRIDSILKQKSDK